MTDEQKELGQAPESIHEKKPEGSEVPATMDMMGNWEVTVKGEQIRGVRGLEQTDLSKIAGEVNSAALKKEKEVVDAFEAKEPTSDQDVIDEGKTALETSTGTQEAVKGEMVLLNKLLSLIRNGIAEKTPQIFVVEGHTQKFLENWNPSLKGQKEEFATSPLGTEKASEQIDLSFVVKREKGEEIKKIFEDFGHQVMGKDDSGGFQAEMGRVRMNFLYPDNDAIIKGGEAANVDVVKPAEPEKQEEAA